MPKPRNHKEKISLHDSKREIVTKLSEGNPGALNVILELLDSSRIDPDSVLGGFGNLLSLDTHGIYGSNIWLLYKDCCGQSILNVVTVLRAVQLGLMSEATLWKHIDGWIKFDMESIYKEVKDRLPNFNNSLTTMVVNE